jgi:hypothetical protein
VRCGEQRTHELVNGLNRLWEWWLKSNWLVEEALVADGDVDGASDVSDDVGVMVVAVEDGMVARERMKKE